MDHLHLDWETASRCDLKKFGLDVYARHETTRPIMLSYAFGDGPVHLWEAHKGSLPKAVAEAIEDPEVLKIAHNAQFEIAIARHSLGLRVDPAQWHCTMVMALSLGLPGALGQLIRDALQLPAEFHKDPEGDRLMRLFSYPNSRGTPESHPEEWRDYCGYGMQDVVAERKVYKVLRRYVRDPDRLWREWCLDQKINAAGIPLDLDFIEKCQRIAADEKLRYKGLMKELTGLENPNSTTQLLPWLQERGYPYSSLAKNRVEIAMREFGDDIDGDAKQAIRWRLESNKTSTKKFDALATCSYGGRLRNTFQFMGAAATGRYAGRILGQNMPRPWKPVEDYLGAVRDFIAEDDPEGLRQFFGQPLECVVSSIRSAIAPPKGKVFVVADLSSIELVVIAWLTDCRFWLGVVRSGQDAYKAFAVRWMKVAYEEVTKFMRGLSKPPALGCGYRMGPGREVVDPKTGDKVKTGLWGYAANMGVEMTKEQCKEAVKIYRDLSPEIENWWHLLDEAAMECVRTHEPQRVGKGAASLVFSYEKPFLRMRLPSGRYINYCRPRIEPTEMEYEDDEGNIKIMRKTGLTYERLSQTSKKWVRRANHGGRFIEQAVQGIARDILQHGLHAADAAGFEVVAHYHDEIVTMCDGDSGLGIDDLIACMTKNLPAWADGMPVGADGYEGHFYRK